MGNSSAVTEFILAGITDQPQLQLPFFFLFFLNYLVTVVGNFSLINLICLNPHLHTPMYFFLLNLSVIDLCHSLIITPKMLSSFVAENVISFAGCMTQLFFFCFFVHTECYVLTAMAYDRYAAICRPLTYTATMSPQLCSLLVLGSYVLGFAGAMVHTGGMLRLSFCEANVIHHYMCDIFPLLQLSCSSTHVNELVDSTVVSVVVIASSLVIVVSYALILSNILHMASSSQGLSKAFSTCGSHIATVALFYGSGMFTHLKTSPNGSPSQGRFFSVFYTNVVPMLNPLIYSLRNKDVKLALKKTLKKMAS